MHDDQIKVKLYYVAQTWHENAPIASLPAPYVARILDRKCQHKGMYCLYTLIFRDGWCDQFPPDSILFGNSIVWKTGAIQVVQYAVEQITEEDLALGNWIEWRMWIAHCRKQLDSGYDVLLEHQPRFWRYGKTIPPHAPDDRIGAKREGTSLRNAGAGAARNRSDATLVV